MKRERVALFALAATVLLGVPLTQVVRYERVIASGREYRFQCEPFDPYAPFSGRYIAVQLKQQRAPAPPEWRRGDKSEGWAHLQVGSDGLAFFSRFTRLRPAESDALRTLAYSDWQDANQVRLRLNVDRYYVTEVIAAEAEHAFLNAARDGQCEVVLRAAGGVAVPVALLLNGEPIEAVLASSE